ncbi:MAG: 50S ribosomal protein L18 [Nanoarchaeota archaeon]|nr:50S ribosomal protein L18 [Nanoarchaeota archaeon]
MNIAFRRKREGKTDYKKRLRLLASGKPRLVVRKTNKNVIVQLVQFNPESDKIVVSAHTNRLKKYGWKGANRNIPASYLTGLLCGLKAKKADVKEAVFDSGLHLMVKGSVIYAALKGALDAGLDIPHSKEVFPSEAALAGKHIESNKVTKFTKFNPGEITKNFEEVKNKIMSEA